MVEGWRWRDRRTQEHAAWMVAYLLQPYRSRGQAPIQPKDLLAPAVENGPATMQEHLAAAYEKQAAQRARQGD
jgi:hypothetical protein